MPKTTNGSNGKTLTFTCERLDPTKNFEKFEKEGNGDGIIGKLYITPDQLKAALGAIPTKGVRVTIEAI